MKEKLYSKIVATGEFAEGKLISNQELENRLFLDENGNEHIDKDTGKTKTSKMILDQFQENTGISSRLYVEEGMVSSTISIKAVEDLFASSKFDPEKVDCIIGAHNFGDVYSLGKTYDVVPNFAIRIKNEVNKFRTENGKSKLGPEIVAYDIIPGENFDVNILRKINGKSNFIIYGKNNTIYSDELAKNAVKTIKDDVGAIVFIHEKFPCISDKVKNTVGIKNASSYDIIFGCGGSLEGIFHSDYLIKNLGYENVLVHSGVNLPIVSDPFDWNTPLFAAGGGAILKKGVMSKEPTGLISNVTGSYDGYLDVLNMGSSNNKEFDQNLRFLKMDGHGLFKLVRIEMPKLMQGVMIDAGISYEDVNKIVLHQANYNMNEKIIMGFYGPNGMNKKFFNNNPGFIEKVMPSTVNTMGNPSGASILIVLNRLLKGMFEDHKVKEGDYLILGAMGAGPGMNAGVYLI